MDSAHHSDTHGEMNSALRAKYVVLRDLLARADADELRSRHHIGLVVLQVLAGPGTYGTHAVGTLASALKRSEATLYRYAQVAKYWDTAAIELLLRAHGGVSWSHLIELAGVTSARTRERLTQETLAEALSVRALVRRIRAGVASRKGSGAACGGAAARLKQMVAATEALKPRMQWHDSLVEYSPVTMVLLERAMTSQTELRDICARNLERLTAAKQRFRGAATPASEHGGSDSRSTFRPGRSRSVHGTGLLLAGSAPSRSL